MTKHVFDIGRYSMHLGEFVKETDFMLVYRDEFGRERRILKNTECKVVECSEPFASVVRARSVQTAFNAQILKLEEEIADLRRRQHNAAIAALTGQQS